MEYETLKDMIKDIIAVYPYTTRIINIKEYPFAGCAVDKDGIEQFSDRLVYALQNIYVSSQNFLGISWMKVFRGLIYLMRGMMKADHRFYKIMACMTFYRKQVETVFKMKLVGSLIANLKIKAKMEN